MKYPAPRREIAAIGLLMLFAVLAVALEPPVLSRQRSVLANHTSTLDQAMRDLPTLAAKRMRQVEVLHRRQRVDFYADQYRIPRELSEVIYDLAVEEGIDPAMAFQLIDVESGFQRTVVSHAGAIGYAQVMPPTARRVDSTVTLEQLYETRTNIRIGFRYLSYLMDRYEGDTRIALLAYNRGPHRVEQLLSLGRNPANGYAQLVLQGRKR